MLSISYEPRALSEALSLGGADRLLEELRRVLKLQVLDFDALS